MRVTSSVSGSSPIRVVDGPWAAGLGPGRSDPALASDGHLDLIGLNSFQLANLAVPSGLLSPYFF